VGKGKKKKLVEKKKEKGKKGSPQTFLPSCTAPTRLTQKKKERGTPEGEKKGDGKGVNGIFAVCLIFPPYQPDRKDGKREGKRTTRKKKHNQNRCCTTIPFSVIKKKKKGERDERRKKKKKGGRSAICNAPLVAVPGLLRRRGEERCLKKKRKKGRG